MRVSFQPSLVNDEFGDPAMLVDFLFERRAILFDIGDLRALPPRKILRISDIFVSHCHMDHFMGFDWFLRICLGRERGVRLYGPPGFIGQVSARLSAYTWNLLHRYENDFCLTVHELRADGKLQRARFRVGNAFTREPLDDLSVRDGLLLDEAGLGVRAAILDHGTPCLGFCLAERQHVNIWKNRLQARGLPVGPWLKKLKDAVLAAAPDDTPIDTPLGVLDLAVLRDCLHVTSGSRIAYVTDVVFSPGNAERIVALARGADWLFIESVFLDELAARAADKKHLTAAQAGRLAREAGVRTVVPFHFSPVYRGEEALLREEVSMHFRQAGRDG